MGDWKITVINKTGDGGMTPVTVDFMLFQTVPVLTVDSWSCAWKVAEVADPGEVGPIDLPTRVEFYILDKSHGNPRETGPVNVKFGKTIEVTQKEPDDAPKVSDASKPAPEGEIVVVNKHDNPKPLEFALYKDGKKILSYKDIRPALAVHLAVKPYIYIAQVENGSIKEGDDFKAVVESDKATKFQLFPNKPEMNIEICQNENQEIFFKLEDDKHAT